jgi:hypothetical protein
MNLGAKRTWGVAIVLTGVALALAQTPPRLASLRSKQGDFAIEQIRQTFLQSPEGTNLKFDFAGTPLRGFSRTQNLDFTARRATGTMVGLRGGSAYLGEASLTGSVTVNLSGKDASTRTLTTEQVNFNEDANGQGAAVRVPGAFRLKSDIEDVQASGLRLILSGPRGGDRTVTRIVTEGRTTANYGLTEGTARSLYILNGQNMSANLSGNTTRVNLPGAFTADLDLSNSSADVRVARKAVFTGRDGQLELERSGRDTPLNSFKSEGPVTTTVNSVTAAPGTEPQRIKLVAKGSAVTATRQGERLMIRLSGDVSLDVEQADGTGLEFQGNGASDVVEIVVDRAGRVLRYELTGGPARVEGQATRTGGNR